MFTPDQFFTLAMSQRYGITDLQVTTSPKVDFTYLDEANRVVRVARPILAFTYRNAEVTKLLPMAIRAEWVERAGVAVQRVFAVCAWGADEIEAYIKKTVADLHDNHLVKGTLQ